MRREVEKGERREEKRGFVVNEIESERKIE